jgi:formamidopyrimidine-DNA glycosylase
MSLALAVEIFMPELPEVETVRRGLQQFTCDRPITQVEVLLPRTIAHPSTTEDFVRGLKGTEIEAWQRRGKYLFAACRNPQGQRQGWLGVHLRMTGQLLWLTEPQPVSSHTRVRLQLGKDRELRFIDQRTFGKMWWVAVKEDLHEIISGMGKLGPEPFSAEFSAAYFTDRLHRSRRQIKAALLDQTVVAGIGNIYADEALFMSGIRPTTVTAELGDRPIQTLHQAIIEVLQTSIDAGGTTFSNYLNVQGTNGNYAGQAWVYGKQGQDCRRCGETILKIKAAGRGTHYCPNCQK